MTFSSIKSKMTFSVFLLALVIAFITATLALLYFEKRIKAELSLRQTEIVSLAANGLDDRIAFAQKALLAGRVGVTTEVIATPDSARRFLAGRIAMRSIFDNGIYILTRQGRVIAVSPEGVILPNPDSLLGELCAQTVSTAKPVVSDGFIFKQTPGHAAIIFTVPIADGEGHINAILAGSLNLLGDNIISGSVRAGSDKSGYLYVIDSNRRIIIHPDGKRVMAKGTVPDMDKLLDRRGKGPGGEGIIRESSGAQFFTTYKRISAANWIMVANYPLAEAYAPIRAARQFYLFGSIALLLLVALLAWMVSSRLTSPIMALTEQIKKIADRKVTHKPIPVTSDDEVGTLTMAFNDLLADLAQQKGFYEDLVKCSAIPTFVIDKNHKVLVWNLACEELTGIRALDIQGTDGQMDAFYGKRMKTLADIAIDENFEELAVRYEIISESLLIPNGWHAEGWIKNLNGRDRYLLIETTPIHNNKRELVAAIECLQDITERVEMMEALKESEEKFKSIAEQVNVMLSQQN
jgi:PAS domain S-box-containing protein